MGGLPHLHLVHPKKNLGRIEATEQTTPEQIPKGRLDGIAEVQQNRVRCQFLEFSDLQSVGFHAAEMMLLHTSSVLRRT